MFLPQIQGSVTPHAIVVLPKTDGMEMLLCYEDEGVYVNTYGRITKDVVLQWGEMPTSVGRSSLFISLAHKNDPVSFQNPEARVLLEPAPDHQQPVTPDELKCVCRLLHHRLLPCSSSAACFLHVVMNSFSRTDKVQTLTALLYRIIFFYCSFVYN